MGVPVMWLGWPAGPADTVGRSWRCAASGRHRSAAGVLASRHGSCPASRPPAPRWPRADGCRAGQIRRSARQSPTEGAGRAVPCLARPTRRLRPASGAAVRLTKREAFDACQALADADRFLRQSREARRGQRSGRPVRALRGATDIRMSRSELPRRLVLSPASGSYSMEREFTQ